MKAMGLCPGFSFRSGAVRRLDHFHHTFRPSMKRSRISGRSRIRRDTFLWQQLKACYPSISSMIRFDWRHMYYCYLVKPKRALSGSQFMVINNRFAYTGKLSLRLVRSMSCREVPATVGLYGDFRGGNRLRNAIAKMMERTFMGVEVHTSNICISSGVTAVLDLFFFATCDTGDGCLIPAPYFPAFDNDMAIRNGVEPVPVQPADTQTYIPTAVEMEEAAVAAEKNGVNPRVLLVTNPGNPLGTLYPESTLKELLVWAVNRGMHVLCDEIYANSKFGPSANEFISMEKVASIAVKENLLSQKTVAERVHTAYGMSKDFGMSGFRVGCIHTRNEGMQKFWQNMGMFAAVSNDTQHALSIMLEDEEFIDFYVAENNRRLKKSYDLFTSLLRAENVVYMPACAAMFCWLDLRSLLPERTFEAEDRLWKEIRDECHVILTPGKACHYAEPGFFRACYASMPPDHLKVATQRLAAFVDRKRRKRKADHTNPVSD